MSDPISVPVYLQIVPEYNYFDQLTGAKVLRQTKNRPGRPAASTYVVKLDLQIPRAVFEHPTPEVTVQVPEASVTPPIAVEVAEVDGEE